MFALLALRGEGAINFNFSCAACSYRHYFACAWSSSRFVLSGSVYIEIVFQWPGVGRMLVDAILKRDII